ncbi:hypothetical protein DQ937_21415 [Salmonella enterica subsp. enterica serovar Poona]|nr:hypothetical protein [Salmonella enterica subsp. enterica serovar Poona]
MVHSLVETCKLNVITPEVYMRHSLSHLTGCPVNRIRELLAHNVDLPTK